MKQIFIFSFLLSFTLSYSQVAGYMGKRVALGYSNYFMLAGLGPTYESRDVGFNTTHCFNAEVSIKKRTNLCLSFQMMKTGVDDHQNFEYNTIDQFGNSQNYTYRYSSAKPMKLVSNNVSIGFKFFGRAYIAPVGKYKKLELLLLLNDLTYDKTAFTGTDNSTYGTVPPARSIGTGNYNYKTIAIAYTIGRQRVIADRIVLDFGTRIGIVPAGLIPLTDDLYISLINDQSPENLFKFDTYARQLRFQLINFHIGIGFLAF